MTDTPVSNSVWFAAIQALIPDQVRARVGSYDWLVSMVIMPPGFLLAGPAGPAIGCTTTLVAAAACAAVPCLLVTLLPGVRRVRRTADGQVVGPATP